MIGELLLRFIIYLPVGMLVIHISVSFAEVKNATLMKAFFAALIGAGLNLVFGEIPALGMLPAFVLLITLMGYFRFIYKTTWTKASAVAIVYIVVSWVVGFAINASF